MYSSAKEELVTTKPMKSGDTNYQSTFASTKKKLTCILLFLCISYLIGISSKFWWPSEDLNIRPETKWNPKPRKQNVTHYCSDKMTLFKHFAEKNVKTIKIQKYENCFFLLNRDVVRIRNILTSCENVFAHFAETKGLDNRNHRRGNFILYRYSIRTHVADSPFIISIIYPRGKVDSIDDGYFWIPSFGKEGKAKAFSNFKLRPDVEDPTFFVPKNLSKFLWEDKAAEFIECNYDIVRKFRDTYKPSEPNERTINGFMQAAVHLRKVMSSWGLYNWLWSGSLLGWYRQCAVIRYTSDVDTATWVSGYEDFMKDYFLGKDRVLRLYRKYGRKNDSLEFTLKNGGTRADVFWLYKDVDAPKNNVVGSGKTVPYVWMGVQTFDNYRKGKSIYPDFERICSADLHGYRIYIPCEAEAVIKAEYGDRQWFKPVKKWHWITSPFNVIIDGRWTSQEWDGGEAYEKHDKD